MRFYHSVDNLNINMHHVAYKSGLQERKKLTNLFSRAPTVNNVVSFHCHVAVLRLSEMARSYVCYGHRESYIVADKRIKTYLNDTRCL